MMVTLESVPQEPSAPPAGLATVRSFINTRAWDPEVEELDSTAALTAWLADHALAAPPAPRREADAPRPRRPPRPTQGGRAARPARPPGAPRGLPPGNAGRAGPAGRRGGARGAA